MSKRFLITLITLLVIGGVASFAIFFAKGYTFSTSQKKIVGTGIITITSTPDAASVYIDGHLTTATNATISSLPPKEYTARVVKEGFIPWERKVSVKEGLVTDLKITLFPAIPTIYPLTYNGVKNPVLSPDSGKLAYLVTSGKKSGIWVWTLTAQQPIAFARGSEPHQIAQNGSVSYAEADLKWSPDSKQVLATVGNNNYLLDDNKLNLDPRDITPTLQATLKGWDDDSKAKDSVRVLAVKNNQARKIASDSAMLRWAPDETKYMYSENVKTQNSKLKTETPKEDESQTHFKIYDLETDTQFDLPEAKLHFWLPDSRHVVLVDDGKISIVDFDGTNQAIIYAGKFEDNLVFAWPDSSRLVFISSYQTPTASEPNLFGINLK